MEQKKTINFTLYFISLSTLAGIIFRMGGYFVNRSLWLDEAYLALNIVSRSYSELMQPLDFNQAAPLGFLFIQKFMIQLYGNGDYILRLVPLLSGLLSLYLMYLFARHYTKGAGVPIAVTLFSLTGPLIYYASECKQYSVDVSVTLLIYILSHRFFERNWGGYDAVKLGLICSVLLWVSHPALFIQTSIGFALVIHWTIKKDWGRLRKLIIPFCMCGFSFAIIFYVSLRHVATNTELFNFWLQSFMPMPPWENLSWFPFAFKKILVNPCGLYVFPVAVSLLFVGYISLFLRKWNYGLIFLMPLLITLMASGLHKYPFFGRLLLFITPIIFLVIADGIEWIRMKLFAIRPLSILVTTVLAATLLFTPAFQSVHKLFSPSYGEHIKPVMAYMVEQQQQEDAVYVYYGAKPAFLYYAPMFGITPQDKILIGVSGRGNVITYIEEINQFLGQRRVWFLFSHVYNWGKIDEEKFFLDYLNRIGSKLDEFKAPGSSAYLYSLKPLSKSQPNPGRVEN